MELKILESALKRYIRTFSPPKPQPINICDSFRMATRALLCMPTDLSEFGAAAKYISTMHDTLHGFEVDIVTLEDYSTLLSVPSSFGTIAVKDSDKNTLGLPTRELLQRIADGNYGVVIDLNIQFQIFTTVVAVKSGAEVRVCLEDENKRPFYNLLIRTKESQDDGLRYQQLNHYLQAIISSGAVEATT